MLFNLCLISCPEYNSNEESVVSLLSQRKPSMNDMTLGVVLQFVCGKKRMCCENSRLCNRFLSLLNS